MKYIIILLFALAIASCSDSASDKSLSKRNTEVKADLNDQSQKLLRTLQQSVEQNVDTLVVAELRQVKTLMSEFINSSQFLEANDLRVTVQNYLDFSPQVAQMVQRSPLVASEVDIILQLPEIKEASLPSFASTLNDAGVIVEEQTVRVIEEKLEEQQAEELPTENTNTPDQIMTEEQLEAVANADNPQ